MPTARQRYQQEYNRLVEERKTAAYQAMGFVSAVVKMNTTELAGVTFQSMKELVKKYDDINEELRHIETLLDLIDYNESEDDGDHY